ncbi:regulator [Achromatium sp. WMS2]|nr:regulator [Achromatium sp. WMS2]
MPTYDYRCEVNGKVVEVNHRFGEKLTTWGEVCNRAGMDAGDTPLEAPVVRLATGGNVLKSMKFKAEAGPACASGSCCAGGMCGLN